MLMTCCVDQCQRLRDYKAILGAAVGVLSADIGQLQPVWLQLWLQSEPSVMSVASNALQYWLTVRLDRIEQLIGDHQRIEGGESRGRRWRTGQYNRLLDLSLAAEFQGFARDLHDEAVELFAERFAFGRPEVETIVKNALRVGRQLDSPTEFPWS